MATNLTIDEVTQNVTLVVSNERGPAGPAGPNSVTSATISDGTANLSLAAATVTGTLTANHIHGNLAGSIYLHVRAGEALSKGDPVYVSGSHGTGSAMVPIVMRADASNAAKMPAIAIMDAAVANNGDGHAVINGTIADFDTQAYAINATLYVANGGGMTATKPANAQPVARVERSNLNNGGIVVKVNGLYSDVTIASSQVTDATSAATAGTIVKRDSFGSAAFNDVAATSASLTYLTNSADFGDLVLGAAVGGGGGQLLQATAPGEVVPDFILRSDAAQASNQTYTFPDATGAVILDSTLGAGVNGLSTITGAKSFSGQVQLTGQAATDDNSAMTRGLVDAMTLVSTLASNATVNNNAAYNATSMVLSLTPGWWQINGEFMIQSAVSAAGAKLYLSFAGAVPESYQHNIFAMSVSSGSSSPLLSLGAPAFGSGVSPFLWSQGITSTLLGIFKVGPSMIYLTQNATITVGFSQNTANASDTSILAARSKIWATKLKNP